MLFYIAIAVILFLPGYFLLLAIFGKSGEKISSLERFILSFGLSIVIVDFIAFAYSKLIFPITALSSILGVLVFCAVCFGIYKLKKYPPRPLAKEDSLFSFSKNQFVLIFLLLFLTFFIKTAYLSGTVAPTATDMGHHMYWTKQITETHILPDYEGMPDFIIGEHIALAEIAMISGTDFFSAFPVNFLFLINILGILTVFILTLRIFKNKNIAILTLLFLGVLFAVSSPQAKFVSGGVIGNIMGNFLMPLAFYFYFRAFSDGVIASEAKQSQISTSKLFLSLGIFVTFGLFYTHHLTAFIFLFVFALTIVLFLIINYKNIRSIFNQLAKIIFSRPVIITFLTGLVFFFLIFTPNYIQTSAVETAVGAPSKETREGLTLTNLKSTVGEPRMALGIVGLLILALALKKRKSFGYILIGSWTIMLIVMSTSPDLLFINLPSSRIANYTSYPLAVLAAFGLYFIIRPDIIDFGFFKFKDNPRNLIPQKMLSGALLIILIFVFTSGLNDSAQAFKKSVDYTPTAETFAASRFLAEKVSAQDIVLKDHNYLSADSWMKLFFMQGYKYPLSRGYFKRYEDPTKPREMCTLYMIISPDSPDAKNCYAETGTNYVMVNPRYDSAQFKKYPDFDQVYSTNEAAIFYRK